MIYELLTLLKGLDKSNASLIMTKFHLLENKEKIELLKKLKNIPKGLEVAQYILVSSEQRNDFRLWLEDEEIFYMYKEIKDRHDRNIKNMKKIL